MTGKTHQAFGLLTSAFIMTHVESYSLRGFAIGSAAAFIASTIPDADIYDARPFQVFADIGKLMVLGILLYRIYGIEIRKDFVVAFLVLLCVTIPMPHRGMSHSIFWGAIFSVVFYLTIRVRWITYWFSCGYASHLIIDLVNEKSIPILFPVGDKMSFGFCKSDGVANNAIMILSAIGYLAIAGNKFYGIDVIGMLKSILSTAGNYL